MDSPIYLCRRQVLSRVYWRIHVEIRTEKGLFQSPLDSTPLQQNFLPLYFLPACQELSRLLFSREFGRSVCKRKQTDEHKKGVLFSLAGWFY